ncbi:MAG: TIGR03619 family F420-dependent LLM class oxidoreductase [Actinomycetia bacterium]|nr:TIGR03619 family F420-dependent LLM class oxidoreductase [Actinomycetes bacterium]
MKIRIGFGLGTRSNTNDQESFGIFVDALENQGWDSLWVSERVSGESPDPMIAMAFAAGRTTRIKFGHSVMVLPGRNPVLVAKAIASLDRLSNGRVLPAFGLGVADSVEHQAFGVQRKERGALFNEMLPLMHRLWTEDVVDHDGKRFQIKGARVLPKPTQAKLDVWLGGISPLELKRVGRLGDGWLPSFVTPTDVKDGIAEIKRTAAEHHRGIDEEHYGVLLSYHDGDLDERLVKSLEARRPELDIDQVMTPRSKLAERIESFVAVGASKFVVIPSQEPPADQWPDHLHEMAEILMPLQT